MIYTNKGMLLDKVLCDVIPCVCQNPLNGGKFKYDVCDVTLSEYIHTGQA